MKTFLTYHFGERKGKEGVTYYSHLPSHLPDVHTCTWMGLQLCSIYRSGGRPFFSPLQPLHFIQAPLLSGNRNPFKFAQAKQEILFKSFQRNPWEHNNGKYNWVLSRNNDCVPEIYQQHSVSYPSYPGDRVRETNRDCSNGIAFQGGKTDNKHMTK